MFYAYLVSTSTAIGSAAKFVRCEKCNCEYGYVLLRQTQGQASNYFWFFGNMTDQIAKNRAESELRYNLEAGVDPAPCPSCNHLQEAMVKEVKRTRFTLLSFGETPLRLGCCFFLFLISVVLVATETFFSVSRMTFFTTWFVILGVMILAPLFRLFFASLYDPNGLTPEQKAANGYISGVREQDWSLMMERHLEEVNQLGLAGILGAHPFPRPNTSNPQRSRRADRKKKY